MIIFDVVGKFANFKKIYTNSSTMSYLFPPRTTIAGLIGAIIGCEFDSYYNKMSFKNAMIGVSIRSKLRTYITTLNYMKIINTGAINKLFRSDHEDYEYTQIPFEIVIPESFDKNIIYRIYFHSRNEDLMDQLKFKLKNPVYPVSLGNANMLANINFVSYGDFSQFLCNEAIEVISPSPMEYVDDLKLKDGTFIQKDILPVDFDNDRNPKTQKYIYEKYGKPYFIKTDKPITKISYNDNGIKNENILFPEVASGEFLFA
jgi:CRISPR-associated protein Cas5h